MSGAGCSLIFQSSQGVEPWIDPVRYAGTGLSVAVDTAYRAEPSTILTAEWLHRQCEITLLTNQLRKVDDIFLVVRDAKILVRDLLVLVAEPLRGREVQGIHRLIHGQLKRLEASAARDFEASRHPAPKPDLPAVLDGLQQKVDRGSDPEVVERNPERGRFLSPFDWGRPGR
jgi:hypothetical protein